MRASLWLPLLTLFLGSALTLGTTVVAGRLAAADDRAREQESFLREERSSAYTEHLQAMLSINDAIEDMASTLSSAQPLLDEDVVSVDEALAEALDLLRDSQARVRVVGSGDVVDASQSAGDESYAIASSMRYLYLVEWSFLNAEDRIELASDAFLVVGCSLEDNVDMFTSAASASLGASPAQAKPEIDTCGEGADRSDEFIELAQQ